MPYIPGMRYTGILLFQSFEPKLKYQFVQVLTKQTFGNEISYHIFRIKCSNFEGRLFKKRTAAIAHTE